MSGLFAQVQAFVYTLILGILAGLIFHYYQLSVRLAGLGKYSLYILDFIIWIVMILVVFVGMLWINGGEMRVYVLISLFMGILIYYYSLAKRLNRYINKAARITVYLFSLLGKAMKKPIIVVINIRLNIFKRNKGVPPDDDGNV
ncbi:MAG: spore cortex biosynthesis protein YabQ [Syntrophomonadaceae bacterium]|nr:spore cortex biosynthesis protein YabQ [Syntrophomonadaceae bacterium]MDD3889660.1 spore cortex biosynthesis protein YabQ [Syntrophomonadaceae bacterium]MDD4548942.1 spore cortex biosynthesis protein YabQ [Syntrophomonadaceae bacterium]